MYSIFKNNYRLINREELNALVKYCIKISSIHIKYLSFSGKLFLSNNITYNDIAVDLIAEIFETEDDVLNHFKSFFDKIEPIESNQDFEKKLRFFIISVINKNLPKYYKQNDPLGFKLIRNFDYAINTKGYIVTNLITDKYIHRKEVDFSLPRIEKEVLCRLIGNKSNTIHPVRNFLDILFDALETCKNVCHSLPFFEIISIYKDTIITKYFDDFSKNAKSFEYEKLDTVLLVDEAYERFMKKFIIYSKKVNFSENTSLRFINIMNDIKECYCNLSKKDSINNYIIKNFKKYEMDSLQNKLEYCVSMFNNEILYLLKSEDLYEKK